jgi:uncharacterized protein YpuA (DUF1002 family)
MMVIIYGIFKVREVLSMRRKLLWIFIFLLAICTPINTFAKGEEVVSLGADLTQEQRQQMLNLFGVKEDEVTIIEITNQEERDYLEGLVSDKTIGTKAISSCYVKPLTEGEGIIVETHNITWVTREMFANAMVTAGVQNAYVIAGAPFDVSGTAALTGIMKAFEKAEGESLSEEAKKAASEELVTTGELGEDIGKDKAAELIKKIKEKVVSSDIKDADDIRRIIIEISGDLNINLSQEQIDQIVGLMEKIQNLDLNAENIREQLGKIAGNLDEVKKKVEENKGLIQKILDTITSFFHWVRGLFS